VTVFGGPTDVAAEAAARLDGAIAAGVLAAIRRRAVRRRGLRARGRARLAGGFRGVH